MKPGEAVISGDFSENYNFIIQNSSQGYHWNNHGCTVHPWQVYYRLEGDTEVSHKSFAMISDELGVYYVYFNLNPYINFCATLKDLCFV